jgi:hypothetical protein
LKFHDRLARLERQVFKNAPEDRELQNFITIRDKVILPVLQRFPDAYNAAIDCLMAMEKEASNGRFTFHAMMSSLSDVLRPFAECRIALGDELCRFAKGT